MKEYTYAVACVRAKEAELLTMQDIDMLISAKDRGSAERVLRDGGKNGNESLWEFMEHIGAAEIAELLKLPTDYHNIKAAVKSEFSGTDADGLLKDGGTTDKHLIYSSVKNRNYTELPQAAADTAQRAMKLILETQDGQLCDIFIDNAMLDAVFEKAKQSGNEFLIRYAEKKADISNLKTAVRCAVMNKSLSFTAQALYRGGSLDTDKLADCAARGTEPLVQYLLTTDYADSVPYIKTSAFAFEKWCDDSIIGFFEATSYDCFSPAPILAYAYTKLAEEKTVNMILSAKESRLDSDILRERVRKLYE